MNNSRKRRTQAERTAASDKAMFRAAIKLIAKEGPSKMTLAKIGKVAGFSGGLVSYRFGSKSKLLQATADRILDLWTDHVLRPAQEQASGVQYLELAAKLYLEAVESRSDLMIALYRLMNESYSSYKELQPAFEAYDKRVRQGIVESLKPAQKAGEIDPKADLEAFAVLYMGKLRGIALQHFIDRNAFDIDSAYNMVEQACDRILLKS